MANINAPKIEYFESFANEITSKFRRLQSIVGHPTASGDYHEEILRTVLRNFLSKRFSVKKGFIYAGSDQVSKQIDLMVIDENSPAAYIFQEGDFAVVIPQAVVAVMEIKTTINAPDFDQALENISSAKSLMEFRANLTGIVFGFDGTNPSDNTLDRWFKRPIPTKFNDKNVLAPNAIMFFTAKSLLVYCNEQGQIAPGGKYYHRIGTDDEGKLHGADFQLSVILAMIVNACEQKEFTRTRYFADRQGFGLVQFERGDISLDRFTFGEGKSKLIQS
ncbi:MAG: hypothetical protein HY001_03320 [Candidatus Portnoybacteria bacterium]|nr:hypothetical protein [Candidatus Portnoybacteria bacterium]